MQIIVLSFLLIIVWIAKKRISSVVAFNVMWLFFLILHKINLCGLYPVQNRTYWIVVLGVFSFDVGYFLKRRISFHKNDYIEGYRNYSERSINEPMLFVVLISHTLLNAVLAARMIPYIFGGSTFSEIRAIFQGYNENAEFYTSRGINRLWAYVGAPWMTVLSCVIIYTIIRKKRLRKIFYILYIVDLAMYFTYTASRATIFTIMLLAAVFFLVYRNEIDAHLKRRIYLIVTIIFALVLLFTSLSFRNRQVAIYRAYLGLGSLYIYAVGPISLLDIFIANADSLNIQTFGTIFISPIIRLFNAGKLAFGMNKSGLQLFLEELNDYKETFRFIAPGVYFNAYGTLFYDFYLDFRYVGIVIGCVLYGVLTNIIEEDWFANRRDSDLHMMIGGLFILSIVYSIVRWHFSSTPYFLSFLYLLLICNNIEFTIGRKRL